MGKNKGGQKMNYLEMYVECFYEWRPVETRIKIIGDLKCKSIHFYSEKRHKQGKNSNLTFFIVNGNIIGVAEEHCEGINIFGKDF